MNLKNAGIAALFACGVLVPRITQAQAPDSGAFFVRLGRDTLAVERYVRNDKQLIAEAVMRTPQTRRLKLSVTFNDKGGVSWYELLNNPVAGVPNSAPVLRSVVTYAGDSAHVEVWAAAQQGPTRSIPAGADMIPLVPPFYSAYETALARAHKPGTDSVAMTMLSVAGPLPYQLRWNGDSVTLSNAATGSMRALMDKSNRLVGLNGAGTTFKVVVTRAKWADLDAYTKRYAAADAQGKAMGVLSPRDTIDQEVGSALITIDYGRPSKRGRAIFGGLVPWGEVWRTGANSATGLVVSDTIEINGVRVDPGKYTMWTLPDPKQWQLIINQQTGQWGTEYDPKKDVVRIPVKSERVAVPVEMFTIAVRPGAAKTNEGTMTLTWDRTRVVVPIKSVSKR